MLDQSDSCYEAYQAPPVTASLAPTRGNPAGRLKTICIIASVLGLLGCLTSLASAVTMAFGRQAQASFTFGAGALSSEQQEVQTAMQRDAQALDDKWRPVSVILLLLQLTISGLLLGGGTLGLRRAPQGRPILLLACSAALVFDLVHAVVQTVVKIQASAIAFDYMPRLLDAQGKMPGQLLEFSLTVAKIVLWGTLLVSFLWLTAQLVFYIIAIRHLRKPEVQGLFQPPG